MTRPDLLDALLDVGFAATECVSAGVTAPGVHINEKEESSEDHLSATVDCVCFSL